MDAYEGQTPDFMEALCKKISEDMAFAFDVRRTLDALPVCDTEHGRG